MSKRRVLIVLASAVIVIGAVFAFRAVRSNPERILARADKYFKAKSFDEARLEYFKVLRLNPGNARAIRQLGLTWAEMGSPVQSGLFLSKANAMNPDNSAVRHELAKAFFATNRYAEARAMAVEILKKEPTDGEIIVMMASTSFTPEQLDEARGLLRGFDPEKSAPFHLVSAIIAGRKEGARAAKSSLDKALTVDPSSVTAHLATANFYMAANEREKALASLKQAAELSEPYSQARLMYSRALAQNGQQDEAVALVRKITETARFYLPAWILLGELTLHKKDTKAALAMANEVLGRDTTNLEGRMLKAAVLQVDGKTDEATKEMEAITRIYPRNTGIKMTLARNFLANGDTARGMATLEEILQLTPNNPDASLLLARTKITTGAATTASVAMEKLLEQRPDMPQAEQLLAEAYQAEGRLEEAAGIFRKQIARNDRQPAPHFMLGMILRQQGKQEEALSSLQTAQSLAPQDQATRFQLIELDIGRGDFESALRRAREQETLTPGNWAAPFLEGKVYTAQEKWAEAEKALLKALDIQPDSLTVYNILLKGYMRQGRISDVITRLENYLEQKPESTSQRLILAMLCGQTGQTDKQVAAYERVLADNPDFVPALNNLAYAYAGPLNNLARAQELVAKARTLQPDSPFIADTLGWILFQQKNFAQALPLLEEAAAKLPDNPEVQYHVGMVRYMQGQKSTARPAFEKALALNQEFPGRDKAREYLTELAGGTAIEKGATIESLQERLKETPGDLNARMNLARLQRNGGKFTEAAASYLQALESNAGLVEALIGLSSLYGGPLQDKIQATNYARRARALDARSPAAARALGEALLAESDFRYAHTLLQEAMLAEKEEPGLKLKFAQAAYGIGKTAEARSTLQGLAAQTADSPETLEARRFLALTGDLNDATAAETAAKALKEKPGFLPALMAQAILSGKGGSAENAIGAYERILKDHPEFVPAQKSLANLLSHSAGRLDEAQTLAEKARQALPDDPELARTLGIIRYQKGAFEPAVRLLKESNAKTPLDAEGLFYLGMAHLGALQKDDGLGVLKRAVEMGLSDNLKQKAQEAIAKEKPVAVKTAS